MEYAIAGGLVLVPSFGGFINSALVRNAVQTWYQDLVKPSFTPPDKMFGPTWIFLYTSMGYASYLIYKDPCSSASKTLPLALYGVNLALNWAWTPIFFSAQKYTLASIDIVACAATAGATAWAFYEVNPTAGYLLLPYFAWLTLASAVNISIAMNNDEPKLAKSS
eukprot:m.83733 g.83733  ORF g.83733 m.83733 type:complete len:165 (+) comp21145_c2_seq1:419-913(+)